jgi:prepilin-type N-terminal cleavage/methylation domain-containing protein
MKRGFTLVEVLIVCAIVGLLAAIVIPSVIAARRGQGARADADKQVQVQQEASMKEAVRQTGLPAIRNFQEKKMMKMLYELRDREDLVCHAYLVNQFTGKVGQYIGKCIGYGLPASTQYSNPEARGTLGNVADDG